MLIEIENKEQDILRTYRMAINGDLIEHIPTKKAVDITQKDFEELPPHIQEGITPYFVSTFKEVLKICFPKK